MSITDYHAEFMQDIHAYSEAEKNFTETVFTERMCDFLVEEATVENYAYIGYKNSPRSIRADAWNYNNDTEVLSLFITDFRFSTEPETLSNTEVTRNFRRLEKFFSGSLNNKFLLGLEESSPAYGLAREINDLNKSSSISRIQFFLSPLAKLKNLNALFLVRTQVSDLSSLAELTNLKELSLVDTQVSDVSPLSDEQVQELRQAFPKCDIVHSTPVEK